MSALLQRALDLLATGQLVAADAACRQILAIDRKNATAFHLRGIIALRAGDAISAVQLLEKALKRKPKDARLALDLGHALLAADRPDGAAAFYRRVIAAGAGDAAAHLGLARAASRKRDFAQAIEHFQRALELAPTNHDAHLDLGVAFHTLRRFPDAEACHRRAVALRPQSAVALYNLGAALQDQGKYEEALACHDRALQIQPSYEGPHFNRALIFLAQGRLRAGFDEYHWRPQRRWHKAHNPHLEFARSVPGELGGRRVVLIGEQGLGDQLFFLRFAPVLKARGARLLYRGGAKLASVVARADFPAEEDGGEAVSTGDYVMLVGDLPAAILDETSPSRPPPLGLSPLPERVTEMRDRLAAIGPAPYIGVVWRAGSSHDQISGETHQTVVKEAPLDEIAEALVRTDATVIALQRSPRQGEVAQFAAAMRRPVSDFCHLNDDLEGMLAMLSLLDEYVGVSSTNNHLLAGLGQTARVLVPFPPEWRWQADGDESPWFEGSRVYRQRSEGEWRPALANLGTDLAARFPAMTR